MKLKVSADIDLETIPDCISVGSSHRKSSNSSTLPSDARSSGKKLRLFFDHLVKLLSDGIISWAMFSCCTSRT
jgi:hypothetical protein